MLCLQHQAIDFSYLVSTSIILFSFQICLNTNTFLITNQIQKSGFYSNATSRLVRVRAVQLILLPLHKLITITEPQFLHTEASRLSDPVIAGNKFLQTLHSSKNVLTCLLFTLELVSQVNTNRNFLTTMSKKMMWIQFGEEVFALYQGFFRSYTV